MKNETEVIITELLHNNLQKWYDRGWRVAAMTIQKDRGMTLFCLERTKSKEK